MPVSHPDRQKLLAAARRRGFPSVQVRPGETLPAGEALWTLLCEAGSTLDLKGAADGLRAIKNETPPKPDQKKP